MKLKYISLYTKLYFVITHCAYEHKASSSVLRISKMAEVKPATMERDFSKVIITLENVLIPDDKLSPTPSMQDGLDLETETDLRIHGCELIQTAGILLKLPQV